MERSKLLDRIDGAIWYVLLVYVISDIFSIAVVQISAITLIILFIFKKIAGKSFSFSKNPLNIPLLIFIGTRTLSVFLSIDFQTSLTSLYKEILFYFIFFVFVNEIDIKNRQKVKLILQLVIISGIVATLYGLSVYIFVHHERISSTASGYYTLGMYLTACLALSLMTGDLKEIFPKRYLWWITNFIFIAGILFTFDRVHWIAMTMAVVITGIVKERKFLIVYLVLIVGAIIVFPTLLDRITLTIRQMDFSERGLIWKGAYTLMWQHPVFGFGTETFNMIFPYYNNIWDKGVGSWHNDYIQIYIESGLVCLAAYIYFIVIVYIKSFKTIKIVKNADSSGFGRKILPGLLLAVTCFLISGYLLDPITRLIFLLFVSLIALIVEPKQDMKSA